MPTTAAPASADRARREAQSARDSPSQQGCLHPLDFKLIAPERCVTIRSDRRSSQLINRPPETLSDSPVVCEESLEARNKAALATSSCLAYLRRGVSARICASCASTLMPRFFAR